MTIPLQLSSLMVDLEDNLDNLNNFITAGPVAANDDLPADVEHSPVEYFRLKNVRGEQDVGHVVFLVIDLARLPLKRRLLPQQ